MTDVVQLAKTAREHLAAALNALQTNTDVPEELMEVADPIAEAMSVFHRIERSNGTQLEGRAEALAHVRGALDKLQAIEAVHPAVDAVMEAVAGSLSKAHALARYQPAKAAPAAAAPVAAPAPAPAAAPPPIEAPVPGASQPATTPTRAVSRPGSAADAAAPAPWAAPAPAPQPVAVAAPAPQPIDPAPRLIPVPDAPAIAPVPAAAPAPWAAPSPSPSPFAAPAPSPSPFAAPAPAPSPFAAPAPAPAPVPAAPSFSSGPAFTPAVPAQTPPVAYTAPPQPEPYHQPAPAAPEPYRPPAAPAPGAGSHAGKGPTIVVELGTRSASNFYKGLAGNDVVEHGGVFVATYKVPKIGSIVELHVLLPGNYEFYASALVQWVREPHSDNTEPGFGARFVDITPDGRQLVYRYARNREPLFYDDL